MEESPIRERVQFVLELFQSCRHIDSALDAGTLHSGTSSGRPLVGPQLSIEERRASATPSASSRHEHDLESALRALDAELWEVRREVVLALGMLEPTTVIGILKHLATNEPEWRVRVAVAAALTGIVDRTALQLAKKIAAEDPHQEVRARAIEAMGDLVLASHVKPGGSGTGAMRMRGAVRAPDASLLTRVTAEVEAVLELLEVLRSADDSALVRQVADKTLGRLQK